MSSLSNEKDFQKQLEEISELYENSKDCLIACEYPTAYTRGEILGKFKRLHKNLARLRDIACVGLRSKHNIGDN